MTKNNINKNYGKKFKEYFDKSIWEFANKKFLLVGIFDFDIVKFDDYMCGKGYDIEKHGSLKEYIEKNYGKEQAEFVRTLVISLTCKRIGE